MLCVVENVENILENVSFSPSLKSQPVRFLRTTVFVKWDSPVRTKYVFMGWKPVISSQQGKKIFIFCRRLGLAKF